MNYCSSPEMTFFYPIQVHYTGAPVSHDEIDASGLAALTNDISDATVSCSEATPSQLEADTYYPSVGDQAQDYMPEPTMVPATGFAEVSPLATTLDREQWNQLSIGMPHAIMSPSFPVISPSSYHALQHIISTPSQPQADMSSLQGFAQLLLDSEYAVSPAALEMSPYQVITSIISETHFNPILFHPELYSTSSTPSSPSSLSYGNAWTTGSDSADFDYTSPPRQKLASSCMRKTAGVSPAAPRTPKTHQHFAPPSPSLPLPNSPVSRAPAVKYTKRRTRQVATDRDIAEPETDGPRAYMCPLCEHHQANRHLPDLRRHIVAHYPDAREHVCRGVCLAVAPPGAVERFGVVEEVDGEERVGGCYQVFSRYDALLRHLQNPNKACLYDASELRRRAGTRKARAAAPTA